MAKFYTYFLYFFIYSVLGWIIETIYCRILDKKWTNRGFLFGPYCPIYGFGSLLIIAFLNNFSSSPIKVFFLGMLFTSTLEYVSSFLLEKIFNAKWWDYSKRKFNINGRVCLLNSLEFAILGIILTYFAHPAISNIISKIPYELQQIKAIALITIMAIDLGSTLSTLLNLKERLIAIKKSSEFIKTKENIQDKIYDSHLYKEFVEFKQNIITKRNKQIERILNAFPDFEFIDFKAQIAEFKEEISKKKLELKSQKEKRRIQKKQEKLSKKKNRKYFYFLFNNKSL